MNDRKKAAVLKMPNRKHILRLGLAFGVVSAAMGATASTAAFQDIAAMTDTRTSHDARWMVRLSTLPQGSVHEISQGREAVSSQELTHVMGVQTVEGWQGLHGNEPRFERVAQSIKSDEKGDWGRPAVQNIPFEVASLHESGLFAPQIISHSKMAANTLGSKSYSGSDGATMVAIATKRPDAFDMKPSSGHGSEKGLPVQMLAEARLVAQKMVRVMEQVRVEGSSPTALAAYAPREKDIAVAFSDLLSEKSNSGKIVLGKGDHKWAANELPASVHTKRSHECLSKGIYFEARGESLQGQKAVAQVILNRVKNPAYPDTICKVVFQNEQMRNACQFSFACDGIRDDVSGSRHWRIAQKVARDAIEGRFWLTSVGSSSHYHADYVWPKWRRSMTRMVKIGRHIFYRTRKGGWS